MSRLQEGFRVVLNFDTMSDFHLDINTMMNAWWTSYLSHSASPLRNSQMPRELAFNNDQLRKRLWISLIKECKLPVRTDCKTVILIQLYTSLTLSPLRVKVYWKVNPVSPSVDPGCKNVFWVLWPLQPMLQIRTSSSWLCRLLVKVASFLSTELVYFFQFNYSRVFLLDLSFFPL